MTKKFVVSTDPMTAAEETALADKFRSLGGGCGWWHWLPNFWLIVDHTDTLTAASIRDHIHATNKKHRTFVAEVTNVHWAGATKPDAQGRDMGEWLRNNWG